MKTSFVHRASIIALVVGCHASPSLDYAAPPSPRDLRTGLGSISTRLAADLRNEYRSQVEKAPPPMGLVPSDGSELAMRALAATVTIAGPLAHTELHFTFHNAENRVREGRFRIELPQGAAVGRFAMLVGDQWREARTVTRGQGRKVYETFLHRQVDPALLEQDLGNQFSARVFPIPANADKEIIVAYDHLVSAAQPYTLALHGLPAIPTLSVEVDNDGVRRSTRLLGIAPDDLTVAIARGDTARTAGDEFVVRVDAPKQAVGTAALDRVLFLVDTSASRSEVMGNQVALLRRLLAAMPADAMVAIAAYDQEVSELYRGRAGSAAGSLVRLFEHGALGASDLGAALDRAAGSGMSRVVVIGDGVPTLGETDPAKLARRLGSGLDRIDAIQIGGALDRDVLGQLVRAGKSPGAILDGRDGVLEPLTTALPAPVAISVDGASAAWPRTTAGLAPGAPLWIAGRRSTRGALAIRIGDRALAIQPRPGDAKRIGRAVARAEIADLSERAAATSDDKQRAEIEGSIERLALAHDLMSSQTSMLVLESDADEARTLGPRAGGETIQIQGNAPVIDPTSTTQGITLDHNYIRNVPVPGRTFEGALGAAAGAQRDGGGVTISGSSSVESSYYVDGVNTTGTTTEGDMTVPVRDEVARRIRSTAFAFGLPPVRHLTDAELRKESPYVGVLHEVMVALARNEPDRALERASRWRLDNPGDIAAIVGLGEALEAKGAGALAARAYGSLIDLYPNRAELVRAAGERLDRVAIATGRRLAIDAYRRALEERPDQLATYRLLAYALVRDGHPEQGLRVALDGRARAARVSVKEIFLQDARVIGAHVVALDASKEAAVRAQLGGPIARTPSLQIVLCWETDANDVDLHVVDRKGDHAFFGHRDLASGGSLLDDLTDGYGPEMFVVERPAAYPYSLAVHYFNRGPEGVGIGSVQIIRHDGKGGLQIEDRPFVLQKDQATVGLGQITR